MGATASAFEAVSEALERASHLNRIQARGTVRRALRRAGLEVAHVNAHEMQRVIEVLMLRELKACGVADCAATCKALLAALAAIEPSAAQPRRERPEDIFGRLAAR